ncbi:alpha-L-arabinofuranosidase C-terminal domain-containing protein [uncultured Sunxiuqinia sp.]|uniref:alpha-L-arabinofuranosidase C-terminal domain-containing protein n=1 Tax=uncultured Sunxiuqinia sp. TaxID=1573825 RepID=UPI002AA7CE99|nr:alpha-L-arabinofuranosidase C-terminal domain-containing protein [uncultured Sunxiuqinia sp.]
MTTKNLFILMLFIAFSIQLKAQENVFEIKITKPKKEIPIQSNMYGVFFEDINFAADGGLYAELVKNRSFEFLNSPTMGWLTYGKVDVRTEDAPFERNPHYLRLNNTGLLTGTGIINEGFRGIGLKKDESYNLSFYARNIDSKEGKLRVELISSGMDIIAKDDIAVDSDEWQKYTLTLTPLQTDAHSRLRIDLRSFGAIDIEHVSLFPEKTFKGRKNGMRQDLAQALADLDPGIFRFPGGCIIEGNSLATRYQWKNSVGVVENRPINENRWNYEFQHRFTPDYFQSYGLGFFEYFQLCEDLGADALPVVNCGIACQYATEEVAEDLTPYIQDALDLIEFANGPVDSKWGKVRAEMGHPESYDLKMIGIGNEQWGEDFPEHLKQFIDAINARYPDMLVIGSSGPSADGERFDYLWSKMKELDADLVDEHYYKDPEWFLSNAGRYDNYSRKGPKVFAGEYACHDYPEKKNSFYSALCEAAFMTGLERNADVVHLATYAPLFAHVDAWQWKPDMIWFDNLRSVKSANYYVQQLYSLNKGTEALQVKLNKENVIGQNGLYASAVIDENKNQLIIKVANTSKESRTVDFDFSKLKQEVKSGEQILLKADLEVENTLDKPNLIVPKKQSIETSRNKLNVVLKPESFSVFILN